MWVVFKFTSCGFRGSRGFQSLDSVKCHLSQTRLVLELCSILFLMGGCTCEKNVLSLQRHLFPHSDRVETLAQCFFPISNSFFQVFELSTKAAFAKAALTLSEV